VTASSGALALQIIEAMPPAAIVLDVNMPGMDGYEVTKKIRSNPNWHSIPILLFTALPKSEAAIGLSFGANDIMGKPVKIDEMLAKVGNLMTTSQHQLLQAS
jgi:two-component system, sensor histidine kinase and response regulator